MTKDPFLDDIQCEQRLFDEWEKYGSLILAFDFDNTVSPYPLEKEYEFPKVIELLRKCKLLGFHLTLFTSCNEDRFPEIKKYCADNDIPYDSINDTPDFIPFKGRKVYYNLLLDDRAGLSAACSILDNVLHRISQHKYMDGPAKYDL